MRGLARSIRSATAANTSLRARKRPVAAGISAVSRAIALPAGAAIVVRGRFDGGAQIAPVAPQQLRGLAAAKSEAQQNGCLYVSIRLIEITRRVAFRALDDFADHDFCTPAQLGVPRPHVDHQSAIDADQLHHHASRATSQRNPMSCAAMHSLTDSYAHAPRR